MLQFNLPFVLVKLDSMGLQMSSLTVWASRLAQIVWPIFFVTIRSHGLLNIPHTACCLDELHQPHMQWHVVQHPTRLLLQPHHRQGCYHCCNYPINLPFLCNLHTIVFPGVVQQCLASLLLHQSILAVLAPLFLATRLMHVYHISSVLWELELIRIQIGAPRLSMPRRQSICSSIENQVIKWKQGPGIKSGISKLWFLIFKKYWIELTWRSQWVVGVGWDCSWDSGRTEQANSWV